MSMAFMVGSAVQDYHKAHDARHRQHEQADRMLIAYKLCGQTESNRTEQTVTNLIGWISFTAACHKEEA